MSDEVISRIRERRQELDMTQTELAKAADLSPAAISQFESGTRKPSFKTIVSLCDALEVTTDYLLGKANRDYKELLADTIMGNMLEGLMNFTENSKSHLFELYKFIELRGEVLVQNEVEDAK